MKIEILASRTKFIGAIVVSFVLTIFGILLAFFPEYFSWFPLGEHRMLILGFTISVIFAGVVVFAMIRLKECKVAVTIDENGITDHIGGMSVGTVKWDNITGFGMRQQFGNKFVVIYLNNVEDLMKGQSKMRRSLFKQQMNSFGSPVAIGTSMLQGGYDKLREAIQSEAAKRDLDFDTK